MPKIFTMLPPKELQEAAWWSVGKHVVMRVMREAGVPCNDSHTVKEACTAAIAADGDNVLLHALWAEAPTWAESGARGFVRAHNNFRREARRVAKAAAKGDWASASVAEAALWGVLLNHHSMEDSRMFPRLAYHEPRLKDAFKALEAQHHRFDELHEVLSKALDTLGDGGAADEEEVKEAANEFATLMSAHLGEEERLVVPMFLEGYTPLKG